MAILSRLAPKLIRSRGIARPAEAELRPIIEQVTEEKLRERRRVQPLQIIFDILNTGQYATASATQRFVESQRQGQSIWQQIQAGMGGLIEGLTWRNKADWEHIIFGEPTIESEEHEDRFEGLFPDADIPVWSKKVIGFIANVALDPTTYMGFGASKAARMASSDFAQDAVRVAAKQLVNPDVMKGLAQKGLGFTRKAYQKFGDDIVKQVGYLKKHGGRDIARELAKVARGARRMALRQPPGVLRKHMQENIDAILAKPAASADEVLGAINALVKKQGGAVGGTRYKVVKETLPGPYTGPRVAFQGEMAQLPGAEAQKLLGLPGQTTDTLMDLVKKLKGPDAYKGAGQRAFRVLGKEFAAGERYPGYVRAWDIFRDRIGDSPTGQKLSDAWWSATKRGPMGWLRKTLGIFKDPYQKLVRLAELEKGGPNIVHKSFGKWADEWYGMSGKWTPEMKQEIEKFFTFAEQITKKDPTMTINKILDEVTAGRMGVDFTMPPAELRSAIEQVHSYNKRMLGDENLWAYEGWIHPLREIEAYLPGVYQDVGIKAVKPGMAKGAYAPGPTMTRTYSRLEMESSQANMLSWLFDIDKKDAFDMISKHNLSPYVTDIDNMMMARIMTHSRMESRVNLLKKMREFGIGMDEIPAKAQAAVGVSGIKWLGLRPLRDPAPALEGYLFDSEVADVLERAMIFVTGDSMKGIKRLFYNYTSWWKGLVTMTTGFHARNWISNNVTGFMKHGIKWFRMKEYDLPSLVATIYYLSKNDPGKMGKMIQELGISEGFFQRMLNKQYGNKSLKNLADTFGDRGVISEAVRGFDPDVYTKFGKTVSFNPLSRQFIGMKWSHKIGNVVESQSRFKSAFIDYLDGAGKAQEEAVIDWAVMEAKRWFIDYTDLTDAEQKTLRNIIPFYTWLRKNLANQMSGLVLHPQTFSVFPKMLDAIKADDPEFQPELVPEWMKQLGFIPVAKTELGFQMFRPDYPFTDINKIPLIWEEGGILPKFTWQEVKDDLMAAAHPILKTAVEGLTKYNTFFKESMEGRVRKMPLALRWMSKHPQVMQFVDGVLRSAGFSEGIRISPDEEGKPQIDAMFDRILTSNLPWLKIFEDYVLLGNMVIPGFEEALDKMTGITDDYEGLETFFQVLSRWGGIKFKAADIEKEKENLRWEIMEEAEEERRQRYKGTPMATFRSERWRRQQEQRMRRLGL